MHFFLTIIVQINKLELIEVRVLMVMFNSQTTRKHGPKSRLLKGPFLCAVVVFN